MDWVDVAFTAISAACINGLSVIDISTNYTYFGQAVILGLIQLGGLGIMSLSTLIFLLLGRRPSVQEEGLVSAATGQTFRGELSAALSGIIKLTFMIELVGACFLFVFFLGEGLTWGKALWTALFTAISAFCNAGFSLFSSSLEDFAHSPAILYTVSFLILSGSLSPVFLVTVLNRLKGQKTSYNLKLWPQPM